MGSLIQLSEIFSCVAYKMEQTAGLETNILNWKWDEVDQMGLN